LNQEEVVINRFIPIIKATNENNKVIVDVMDRINSIYLNINKKMKIIGKEFEATFVMFEGE
jgi:hypothetical protein